MKKIRILFLMSLTLIFTGCLDDDGYSLSNMWVGFGILQKTSDDPSKYKIIMDDEDEVLIPIASNYSYGHYHDHSHFKNGDRVLVNFTILDDNGDNSESPTEYYVKINDIREILMKGILDITEENEDSIGNDPIIVKDVWITDSLLNLKIKYWGYDETHFINLVKQPGELTGDDQPFELELRHNNKGDSENILYSAYVSFKLNELEMADLDSVQFKITYTDYDGNELDYEGVYHYSDWN